MLVFFLANWKWLIPTAAAAVLGVMLGFSHIHVAELETAAAKTALDIQTQKTVAATTLAASEKHAREVEAKNAELNIQIEKDHANAQKDLDNAHGDIVALTGKLNGLLREAAGRGNCGADRVPGSGDPAGSGSGGASPGGLPEALGRLIAGANDLFREADSAAEVGQRCHAFAMRPVTP